MEEIKTNEISSLLKQQLSDLKVDLDVSEVGEVIYVGDGVSRIQGYCKECEWLLFTVWMQRSLLSCSRASIHARVP